MHTRRTISLREWLSVHSYSIVTVHSVIFRTQHRIPIYGEALFVVLVDTVGEKYVFCIQPKRYYLLFSYSGCIQSKLFFFPSFDLSICSADSFPRWESYVHDDNGGGFCRIKPLGFRAFKMLQFTANGSLVHSALIPARHEHIVFADDAAYSGAKGLVIGIKDVIYEKFSREIK